ncbi:MAG: hypothetical protein KAT34_03570 [Candidatus Aminicenantes bacterium]|nr:hypothetical protein [Candidatus Aminicenantes bacterium]
MKLEKILDNLNSFEKNAFLKILHNIIESNPKNSREIDKITSDNDKDIKRVDNINVATVFSLIETEFSDYIISEFVKLDSQFDLQIDIIIRDGNCIISRDWLNKLYENELKQLKKKGNEFKKVLEGKNSDIESDRLRDYRIYKACIHTAYWNDTENNQEAKITKDEQSILFTLAKQLELSQEEIKLIKYSILPIETLEIDKIINDLRNLGVLFYSRKNNTVYIADAIVRILRKVRGKEVANKFFRRVLRQLKESQLNLACRKHNINWRLPIEEKIKGIISEGISFSDALQNDIFKPETKVSEKKNFINELTSKGLNISPALKGVTIEEKIQNLINFFEGIEKDEKVGISIDGYEKLLYDLNEILPKLNDFVKDKFELQEKTVLSSNYLLDYNIKPRDILEIISEKDLEIFCNKKSIKTRGNTVFNILDAYKDTENIYIENFENIGFRNLSELKENGIQIKETELGIKFEELTKSIFGQLGFFVDEKLRRSLNTPKNKIDIVLNLGNSELIIIECKTTKDSGYTKFSSVSRQIKSYIDLAKVQNFKVIKSLLIAPDFSDTFVNDCELEYDLNLSLISASSLVKILEGFRKSKLKKFPYYLLMKDVLIKEERILKAINK